MGDFCAICNEKISGFFGGKVKTLDGEICTYCSEICPTPESTKTYKIREYWAENHNRYTVFKKDAELTSGYMTDTIVIDSKHKMFFINKYPKREPVVIYNSEIVEYEVKRIEGKIETKRKNGLGRAVVGGLLFGPAGAIIGASTSTQETKQADGTTYYYLHINTFAGHKKLLIYPPAGAIEFIEKCLENSKKVLPSVATSTADEILKLKKLMDDGIITAEQFESKKIQLLGL